MCIRDRGKGVLICENEQQAADGVKEIMLDKKFGASGNHVVVEEFLLSLIHISPAGSSQPERRPAQLLRPADRLLSRQTPVSYTHL